MTDENKLRKYTHVGFVLSCVFHSILILMGSFCLIVQEHFPDLSVELAINIDLYEGTTSFPPIDIFILPLNLFLALFIAGIYGYYPLFVGAARLVRNILIKLFKLKNAETIDAYKQVKDINNEDLVFIMLNIVLSVGFFELGIYPKIHTVVNVFMTAALCVLIFVRPKIPKPAKTENDENTGERL